MTVGTGVMVAVRVVVGWEVIEGADVEVAVASFVRGRMGYGGAVRSGFCGNASDGFVVIVIVSAIIVVVPAVVGRDGRLHDHKLNAMIETQKAWNMNVGFILRLRFHIVHCMDRQLPDNADACSLFVADS